MTVSQYNTETRVNFVPFVYGSQSVFYWAATIGSYQVCRLIGVLDNIKQLNIVGGLRHLKQRDIHYDANCIFFNLK